MTADAADPLVELSDALVELLGAIRRVGGAAAEAMADPVASEQIAALITALAQAAVQSDAADWIRESS